MHAMEYEYTAINRLKEPHTYMYSQFAGREFLAQYRKDRLSRVSPIACSLIGPTSPNEVLICRELMDFMTQQADPSPFIAALASCLSECGDTFATRPQIAFSLDEAVDTFTLLEFLLHSLLSITKEEALAPEAQLWIDRLVQRFEVSKKLWSQYLAGFRKGAGSDARINLYYTFALLLALAHVRSGGLQYLSTLLKVNDLLLSLPSLLHRDESNCSLVLAVAVEMTAVHKLTPASEEQREPLV